MSLDPNENAPVVNPVAATTGDEGDMNTHMDEGVQMSTVDDPSFIRTIAEIPSDDGDTLCIAAQYHVDNDGTEHFIVVVNGNYGIDVADAPALIEAICAAKAMLDAPTQQVA